MRLRFPADAVVVVAGVPGAGKTTLLRRAVRRRSGRAAAPGDPAERGSGRAAAPRDPAERRSARVLDTDDRRAGRWARAPRALLYAAHYLGILAAIAGRAPVVIHSRGTHARARRAILWAARLRGRPAHLLLLHADRPVAEAGQRARGRRVGRAEMDDEVARWHGVLARVRASGRLPGEPWAGITLLDRGEAAAIEAIDFAASRPRSSERPAAPACSVS